MKNNRLLAKFLLIVVILWIPWFMGAWDPAKPAGSDALSVSDDFIRANNVALEAALTQDHEFSNGGTNSGKHQQVLFDAPISTPGSVDADEALLYTKDASAKAELTWTDEDENTLQITSGGDLFSSTNLQVTGTTAFGGTATLAAGADLVGSATSDITMNTNKFTVAGATGNTLIGGTFDIQSSTAVSGILDEDAMGSDSATDLATQQSIKAYVDSFDLSRAKAMCQVASNGTLQTGSLNITSTNNDSTGVYTITFATDFAVNAFTTFVTPISTEATAKMAWVSSLANGSCVVTTANAAGTKQDTGFCFVAFGTQ